MMVRYYGLVVQIDYPRFVVQDYLFKICYSGLFI